MNEFEIINKYFDWGAGIGDDCALIDGKKNHKFATSVDTLIAGVHFPADAFPADIAYKSLAVNLSDLAAMGATPSYFTLALTLPNADENWLDSFSSSLKKLAAQHNILLVGGDTTKGSLSITINATGTIDAPALMRSGAQVGDGIFISNTLGDAALAFWQIQNQQTPSAALLQQFNRPQPQVKLGQNLLGVANSCIDISDGLQQDLQHILRLSKVGAKIDLKALPLAAEVADYIDKTGDWCLPLAGGDDYQLCFTAANEQAKSVQKIGKKLGINLTKIGVITEKKGLEIKGLNKICKS
ncbi:MAG: thiamine-phosphate kinase, partial [Candidatus Thioglobus sp.]